MAKKATDIEGIEEALEMKNHDMDMEGPKDSPAQARKSKVKGGRAPMVTKGDCSFLPHTQVDNLKNKKR